MNELDIDLINQVLYQSKRNLFNRTIKKSGKNYILRNCATGLSCIPNIHRSVDVFLYSHAMYEHINCFCILTLAPTMTRKGCLSCSWCQSERNGNEIGSSSRW